MTPAPTHPPVIHPDSVYAPILTVLLGLMTPDERLPILEILAMGSRSERAEEAS